MKRAAAWRGARVFDYGRSKPDTGSFSFKKHRGSEPQPLYYEYHLVKARAMPNLSPTNPRYRLFIESRKHMPKRCAPSARVSRVTWADEPRGAIAPDAPSEARTAVMSLT